MISIEGVTKRYGNVLAVDDVSLEIQANEFFALLGPSGCGKTTLLRLLAGFEEPDAGRLVLDGADLVGVKPYRRPLNLMFQSYALFPHMSVEENVTYGLRMEGMRTAEARERAAEALELVGLEATGARRPSQLSGGQRQRVALARALVKRPRLLLLDEPLSALDRQIRGSMQIELKRLQHSVGITFVVVTHDQEEALTMADRIAVMRDGRVAQIGSPDELYEAPATRWVARFLGDANVFEGRVDGDRVGNWRVDPAALRRVGASGPAAVVVRPERMLLAPVSAADQMNGAANVLRGRLAEVAYLGTARRYVVDLERGGTVEARIPVREDRTPLTTGDEVLVGWEVRDGVVVTGDG